MKRCFHRWKRIFTKIHQWSFVKSDMFHAFSSIFQNHPWISMISSVPHRFSSMFPLHRCSPVISAHSSHVFIRDATTSMISGDCPDTSRVKISAIRTFRITRGIYCLSCMIIDYSMSSRLQQKLDSCSCGSTSFYWYPRAYTRQFYKTFPTHLSRRRVRGWQWPQ